MRETDTPYSLTAGNHVWGVRFDTFLPSVILSACVLFNFVLCFLHTNVFAVSVGMIIACEMAIMAVTIAYGFFRVDRLKLFWLSILGAQMLLLLVLSAAKDELLMKPMRDMMIASVFIVLGLTCWRMNLTRLLLWLGGFIVLIACIEAFLTNTYLNLFDIRSYYVDKGGMADIQITDYALFASGVRPNERFLFDFLDIHRISSVFLEPVSLGFYGFISGTYFLAAKKHLSRKAYIAGLVIAYILIWMSDARMAFGSLTIMLLLNGVFAKLDHRLSALIFPAAFIVGLLIYLSGYFELTGEGIGARLHSTLAVLGTSTPEILMGVSRYTLHTEDTALGRILEDQGVLGFLLYWLPPIFFLRRLDPEPTVYLFAISLFLSFGFMLSSAIFTIKTMALMWFIYGYLIAKYTVHGES